MELIPIQVTDEGVLIPKVYLRDAGEVETIVSEDYVLVRSKNPAPRGIAQNARRYSFIGIAHTRNPRASVEAEDILEREIKRESGWSLA